MTMLEESPTAGTMPTEEDKSELLKLCQEITQHCKATSNTVRALTEQVKESSGQQGISFLDMKNTLLASYNANLTYIMAEKSMGKEIEGNKAIERLVEIRTVLEKIRPIDHKLKYQVDKLIALAKTGFQSEDDPLRLKPNPDNLLGKGDSDSEDDEEEDGESGGQQAKAANKLFVAPRNVPQFFEGSKTQEELEQEHLQKKKKHVLSRSIMDDLKDQYLDTPEEVSHKADTMRKKLIEEEKERIRVEEENFMRLPVTKADKARRRKMMMSTIGKIGDEVTSFGRYTGEESGANSDRKRKKSFKGKKGKSKKFKRKH